jgi:threonine dehydratase
MTVVRVTPLITTPEVAERLGSGVRLKLENQQRTGSFKLRGAVEKLGRLTAEERAAGVVTASAGNHGAGLALAASELGIRAKVYVSKLTPANKRVRIAGLGAEVVVDGENYDEAEDIAKAAAAETGATFVSAYDDDAIIAGNGESLARELIDQAPDIAKVVCPVGGGGLIGGLGKVLAPRGVVVVGVQPAANCAMHDSLKLGRALTEYDGAPTLAEGCEGAVAVRTYALAAQFVESIALVSEDAIRSAMAFSYRAAGQAVEASAAVAMAGLLEGVVEVADRGTTAVVLTGGNVEPSLLSEVLG